MRGQTNLPALGVALLVLTTTAGLGLAFAENAFSSAERPADDRRVAVALSERLVSADAPLTVRPNVVNATAARRVTETSFRRQYPVVGDRSVRVRLGSQTLVDAGDPTGGTTVRRLVQVRREQRRQYEPGFAAGNETTVPRRTDRVRLRLDPPLGTTVTTIRVNGRVVRRNTSGLRGRYRIATSRFETATLRFESSRSLSRGDVRVTYYPARTTKATLAVTVDD